MNRVGYFSTAGGGDGAPVESRNQLVLGNISVGQTQSGSGINYSSAGIGGSFQPPSNTYNGSHFYTNAVTDFPNTPGISSINQHEPSTMSREAKYITIVPGGSPVLTVSSPIASAPTSVPPPPQQQSMHIGPMTSVRPTDTLTHSRLPHLSSLEVQYIGGPNQQTLHTVPSDTKFFNSMPDLFTYMDQPGDQQEIDVNADEVYIDMSNPSMSNMNMNRASMMSNSSAMSDFSNEPNVILEVVNITDAERQRAEERKAKLAEAARLRYQKLSAEEKKEVNARRTAALQRKRQRQREIQELESLLRNTNDIQEDPVINEQLREKRIKARRAEAARLRYQRMTPDERKTYNYRRRLRQLGLDEKSQKEGIDPEMVRQHIIAQNARKAEAARLRYHRMIPEEKKVYNRRRTASFKRRKMEEELLLSTPAGQISTEALQKAQQIMVRNAKRAEMARLRYQRMTPEQRREYNARRAQAKKERSVSVSSNTPQKHPSEETMGHEDGPQHETKSLVDEDALTILEREVIKRTKQAQAALMKQRQRQQVLETTTQRTPTIMEQQQQQTPRGNARKRRQENQAMLATMEPVQIEDPNAQRTQIFYSHEGELIEFKQEANQPTIYIQGPQSSVEESIRQIVLQANQLPPGQQPQHILVEIPAEASQTGAPMQTIYQIRTSQAPNTGEIHIQAQPHQLAQFSPDQPVGVVLASHQQQNEQIGKTHYQQQFYASAEDGSIVVEVKDDQPTTSTTHLMPQQQVIYQPSSSYKTIDSGSNTELITPEQKLEAQRAKRAARARDRYRRMSEDERKKFNAKRALALRKARSRDDELCRMAEIADETGEQLDDETIKAIKEAQLRRAKRAESARLKYQRMTSEERRQYNAMRDAQRRQRKREQEEGGKQHQQQQPRQPMITHFVVEQQPQMDQDSQHVLVNAQQMPTQMEMQMSQDPNVGEQTTRGGEPVTIMYSTYDIDQSWAP